VGAGGAAEGATAHDGDSSGWVQWVHFRHQET